MSISTTRTLPSSDTKNSFKAKLREAKPYFSSPILAGRIEEIEPMLVAKSTATGISSNAPVSVRLFDYDEVVGIGTTSGDLSNVENRLIYFPGLEGDRVIVRVGVETATIDFVYANAVTVNGNDLTLDNSFRIGGQEFFVRGAGGALIQNGGPAPTYTVTPSATSVDEGSSINFVVNTENVSVGTTLYYGTLVGAAGSSATSNDLDALTGSFNIVSDGTATGGIGTVTRTAVLDGVTEGPETFRLVIRTDSTTGTAVTFTDDITINNIDPTFNVTPSVSTVAEGDSVTFTINTTNVGDGTQLYWREEGSASSSDWVGGGSGNFLVNNNVGIVTITTRLDWNNETENIILSIRTGSTSGTITTTSSAVTITDTAPSNVTVTASSTTVNEGGSVTFTINGTNIPDHSSRYRAYIIGSASIGDDFINAGSSYKSFGITNNTGSVTLDVKDDSLSEGIESFYVEFRYNSATSNLLATSPTITINDTSREPGSAANGFTFGPVIVNRDNGNAANATDWYKICNIDDLPEGSSIALFIDTSGSMTQATIQASYDAFLAKLNEKNITITSVTNNNEDWITPFLVDLP